MALDFVWVPTWANPADAPPRSKPIGSCCASLPKLPPPPTAVFASAHALLELDLLRCEPLSAAAHTACAHVRKLESPSAFNFSGERLDEASQVTYVGERNSTPSNVRQLPRVVQDEWRDEKAEGAADCSRTSC